MSKFNSTMIMMLILLTYSISNAGDLIPITTPNREIAYFVSPSDIRQNLTSFRGNNWIKLTIVSVFLTIESSREYKKNTPCWTLSANDYKYVLQEIRFQFPVPEGLAPAILSRYGYDKYDNLLCGGRILDSFDFKESRTILLKLKDIFEAADRKDKSEPW